jgi:hypothetical protein
MSRITNKQWHYHVLIQSFYTAILSSFIIIITDIIRPHLKKYYSWTYYDNDGKENYLRWIPAHIIILSVYFILITLVANYIFGYDNISEINWNRRFKNLIFW